MARLAAEDASLPAPVQSPALTRHQFDRIAIAFVGCLLAHAVWLPISFTLATAAVVGLRRWLITQQLKAWPGWIRLPLLILLLLAVRTQFGGLGKTGGSAMLIGLLALKMAESERRRDALLVVTITLFLIAMGFLFNQSMGFTLYMLVPTLLCFWALNELHAHPGQSALSVHALRRAALRTARAIAIAAPLTLALWLFFPRLGAPLWGKPDVSDEATVGLSEQMRPGGMADLLIDDRVAFRARFRNASPDPNELYWRGPVMWRFDGETWRGQTRWMRGAQLNRSDAALPPANLRFEVMLEPTDRPWLFLPDLPISTDADANFSLDFQVLRENAVASLLRYQGTSALGSPAPVSAYLQSEREWGLALPPGLNPRTAALVQQWLQESAGDPAQLVQRALRYFRNEPFYYSLETQEFGTVHRVDEFLFDFRVGFCQHYASSFVVMMRSAGIPARVVTGFHGGYYNFDGFLIVRNSNAHAWAEVMLPGRGWVRVDPTAAVAPERVDPNAAALLADPSWETGSWLTRMKMSLDAVGTWWNQAVLAFDLKRQQSMLAQMGLTGGWEQRAMVMVGAVIAVGAVVGLIMWAPWRRRQTPLASTYARFERLVASRGAQRPTSMGALSFAHLVSAQIPIAAPTVMAFTDVYLQARFASAADQPPPLQELRDLLQKLKRQLRESTPA
ncbi:MAG: DUF3488 domain-containing transglutaminase family protein [Xanthomonadales bacterium]|nr:DUF3488 domain-containing transglutaminase family protein [Xanthomonadales bacterium]